MTFPMLIASLGVSGTWSSSNLLHGVGPTQLDGCVGAVEATVITILLKACVLHLDNQQNVTFIKKTGKLFSAVVMFMYDESLISKSPWHHNANIAGDSNVIIIQIFLKAV
jgi:hypothetical protein